MTVEILWGAEAGRAFTLDWDAVAGVCPTATVFQSAGWYSAWIETVAEPEGATPVVVMVRRDTLRAAMALQLVKRERGAVLQALTTPWADYQDAIAVDREAPALLVRAVVEVAYSCGASLVLDDLVCGGIMETALAEVGITSTESSPVAAIDLTDVAFLAHLSEGHEHQVKLRRLARLGPLTLRQHQESSDILMLLPAFIEMHRRQWSPHANVVAGFDGGVVDRAFEAMVRHLAPRGSVVLTELRLGNVSLAMYFGFRWGRVYGGYRTTFNQSYKRLSPGHLMLRRMISDFADSDVATLDLMRGAYAYKESYANLRTRNRRCSYPVVEEARCT